MNHHYAQFRHDPDRVREHAIEMSGRTAMGRNKPSAPMQKIMSEAGMGIRNHEALDFGAGRGTDAEWFGMTPYDPNYYPEKPDKKFDVVTMIYVLNTLPPEMRKEVIEEALSYVVPGGTLFITVRDDIPEEKDGKFTARKTIQYRLPHLDHIHSHAVLQEGLSKRGSWLTYRINRLISEDDE